MLEPATWSPLLTVSSRVAVAATVTGVALIAMAGPVLGAVRGRGKARRPGLATGVDVAQRRLGAQVAEVEGEINASCSVGVGAEEEAVRVAAAAAARSVTRGAAGETREQRVVDD